MTVGTSDPCDMSKASSWVWGMLVLSSNNVSPKVGLKVKLSGGCEPGAEGTVFMDEVSWVKEVVPFSVEAFVWVEQLANSDADVIAVLSDSTNSKASDVAPAKRMVIRKCC